MSEEYHGILIREGLRDPTVLSEMNILGTKSGKRWTLVKIGADPRSIENVLQRVQTNLLREDHIPYYAHFYRNHELIVVFPEKVFRISIDKQSWTGAVSYGESQGVPKAELDFRPCRVQDETF